MSGVLLLEDEQIYRETLAKALIAEDGDVYQAQSGRAAVRTGWIHRPGVLVADWMLRNHYHGLHVARALQVVDPELQTILITGFPSADLQEEVERLGACQLVEKPFGMAELRTAVRRAVDARRRGAVPRGGGILDIGVLDIEEEGVVRYANRAAEVLLGRGGIADGGFALGDLIVGGEVVARAGAAEDWLPATAANRGARLAVRARRDADPRHRMLILCRADDEPSREDVRVKLLLDLESAPEPHWPFSARVLVVDADPIARRYTVQLLERAGCTCFGTERHDLALRLLGVDYGIHFALLALQGPDDELRATLQQIRKLRPDLRLIGTAPEDRDVGALGLEAFLRKPWSLEDLAIALGT